MLKIVLLPEPFGPIRPRISPFSTANDTFCTAVKPPKRLVNPSTASIYSSRGERRRSSPTPPTGFTRRPLRRSDCAGQAGARTARSPDTRDLTRAQTAGQFAAYGDDDGSGNTGS